MTDRHDDTPYTVDDLMRVTELGRDSVKSLIRSGDLPGYQLGKKYVVPAEGFRALLASTWKPQPRQITVTNISPIRTMNRRAS